MEPHPITFLFGVHNHQPVGNFDGIFENAYRLSYAPFFEVMDRHPKIKFSIHISGPLWLWIEQHHPEYLDKIKSYLQEGRLEVLGGAFYEPILPVLPDRDQLGQLEEMGKFIAKKFETVPQGAWLAERVWEPHLPKILAEAGAKYTVLDDAHFITAGMSLPELTGYFITEDNQRSLAVFPISQTLRYHIPFASVEEVLDDFRRHASSTEKVALVMFDDGEKFGFWPGTYKHVYTDGWLDRFLSAIENTDWISTATFSAYLKNNPPKGRVYLPAGAYTEMGEWAYPPEAAGRLNFLRRELAKFENGSLTRYLRGGIWRNFLTKYAESNAMHKKMLLVSELVWEAVKKVSAVSGSEEPKFNSKVIPECLSLSPNVLIGDREDLHNMVSALWAGQCNCAYWHGVFGGLYLPHLRHAVYKKLLEAERLAGNISGPSSKNGGWTFRKFDYDADGELECIFSGPITNFYVAPSYGGAIVEWDRKDLGINLSNVLTRRSEAYHDKLLKGNCDDGASCSGDTVATIHDRIPDAVPQVSGSIVYDWHRRLSFLDHFLHPDTNFEGFTAARYSEQGDFIKGRYEDNCQTVPGGLKLMLKRQGFVAADNNATGVDSASSPQVIVEKEFLLTGNNPVVVYKLVNTAQVNLQVWFGVELVFAFLSYLKPHTLGGSSNWQVVDNILGIKTEVVVDSKPEWWCFPLETVSQSEQGIERTYQGSVLLAHKKYDLRPGKPVTFTVKVKVTPLENSKSKNQISK